MGLQPSKDYVLPEERLALEEISEGGREECATPNTGRMSQNPAAPPPPPTPTQTPNPPRLRRKTMTKKQTQED